MSLTPARTSHLPIRRLRLARLVALAASIAVLGAGPASAASPAPGWVLESSAKPTNFVPGDSTGKAMYLVTATNIGAAATDGSAITLTDDLPAGVTVQSVSFHWSFFGHNFDLGGFLCTTTPVQCTAPSGFGPTAALGWLRMEVHVVVDPGASGEVTNRATVSGGGAPDVEASETHLISTTPAPFGVAGLHTYLTGPDGLADTRAGGHPYQFMTTLSLASMFRRSPGLANGEDPNSIEDAKDLVVDLPLGLLGSARATPTCTQTQMSSSSNGSGLSGCPGSTVVGEIRTLPRTGQPVDSPLYNMVPEKGIAAQFGYLDFIGGAHVLSARIALTPEGYVLRTVSADVPQIWLTDVSATFFGNPSAHNGGATTPVAMFTNPTDCSAGPLTSTVHADSWQHPGRKLPTGGPDLSDPNWVSTSTTSPPVTGCNLLQFRSDLSVKPDTTVADSPSGLDVTIKVPQPTDPGTLATPPLRKAVVMLPPGLTVNPASADGLGACSPAQIALDSGVSPSCRDNSKIGTVELETPLLAGTLKGSIYLASQNDNPFGTLFAAYIVVDDPDTGVVIKIPGKLDPNPETGQITGTFDNNPQFPFSELRLHFKGGARGVLATPNGCGTFATNADLTPWSAPESGPDSTPSDSFALSSGCVSGFHPTFTAGTQNTQAGAFSPFTLSLSRSDTDEEVAGLKVTLPPGLIAKVAGVALCSDADANAGACPADSQVGSVTTGAGPGPSPLFLPGKAYLTGPYKGAPYGLAVVVPAKAGPFDLGIVVVRQALQIDPTDAHATAISDPFPTILQGIPLRLRRIDVALDRPGFMLNPTSCDPMKIDGLVTSVAGTEAPVSSRFQVGGCSDLAFKPKLAMALSDRTQTTDGRHPGLTAVVTQPGGQANIKGAKVTLPLSLALDPNNAQALCEYQDGLAGNCPQNTIVGHAKAETPLLDSPLEGPIYFVKGVRFNSNGDPIRTLPTLYIPLRGQLSIDLRASSQVNSDGKLVTTFPNVPDAPISRFTLQIDGGKHGILVVSNTDICKADQVADQQLDGQNGKPGDAKVLLATPCPLKILSKKVSKTAVTVTVGGLSAGVLRISGTGIKPTRRTIGETTVATVTAKLTRAGSKLRSLKVRVSFDPAGPGAAKAATAGVRKPVRLHRSVRIGRSDRVRGPTAG
jgi:hypothetical protein